VYKSKNKANKINKTRGWSLAFKEKLYVNKILKTKTDVKNTTIFK
jgi:hypothetical protein